MTSTISKKKKKKNANNDSKQLLKLDSLRESAYYLDEMSVDFLPFLMVLDKRET